MFYYNYVLRPSYALLKSNPKEYWEQWEAYTKAQINAQILRVNYESDMRALSMMRVQNIKFGNGLGIGTPCIGCTLGGGFGFFG